LERNENLVVNEKGVRKGEIIAKGEEKEKGRESCTFQHWQINT
jgi:hypothetical protein